MGHVAKAKGQVTPEEIQLLHNDGAYEPAWRSTRKLPKMPLAAEVTFSIK
ncbi:hypothetical protein O9929_01930 [Vibrio lentus]|nr:hypothetical protein [Vibrio lentus]